MAEHLRIDVKGLHDGTPRVQVIVRCTRCGKVLSDRTYDVRIDHSRVDEEAEYDGHAARTHLDVCGSGTA